MVLAKYHLGFCSFPGHSAWPPLFYKKPHEKFREMKIPFQIKFWTCKIPLSYPEPALGIHHAYYFQGIQILCITGERLVPWQLVRSVGAGVDVWLLVLTARLQGVTLWEGRKSKDGRKLEERPKGLKGRFRGHILDQRNIVPSMEWFVFICMLIKDNLSGSLWFSWAGLSGGLKRAPLSLPAVGGLAPGIGTACYSWEMACLHIWAGKMLFWYSHCLKIRERSPYLLLSTEQGKQNNEWPFGMKGSSFWIQSFEAMAHNNPMHPPLWRSKGHVKKEKNSFLTVGCVAGTPRVKCFTSAPTNSCSVGLWNWPHIGEISVEKELQQHMLVFSRVKNVFCGKGDWSRLGRVSILQVVWQEFSNLYNRQGNTSPKWELKWCSCIIWANTGFEP